MAWYDYTPAGMAYNAGKKVYNAASGKDKKKGYEKAASSYEDLGRRASGMYGEMGQAQLGAYGNAEGAYGRMQDAYSQPGYMEKFYEDNARRQGAYGFAADEMARRNASAFAARGMNNSTMAAAAEQRGLQGLSADYLRQEGQLASAAEASRRGRFSDMYGASMGLGGAKAGILGGMYEGQIGAMSDAEKNAIAARLAAQGVSADQIEKILGGMAANARTGLTMATGA